MKETVEELSELQRLLDASHQAATAHLRSIITRQVALTAEELVPGPLRNADHQPGDSHRARRTEDQRGRRSLPPRWVFSTTESAAKTKHLRARPAASISYVDGERVAVFTHGHVEFLPPEHPDLPAIEEHLIAHYGSSPSSWAEGVVYCRLQPTWSVGYAMDKSSLGSTA